MQYKDKYGTIAILKYQNLGLKESSTENSLNKHELKVVTKVETLFIGFTTFATTIMTKVTKKAYMDHLCLITPCNNRPYFPKIWVLNLQAEKVVYDQTLEILPNQSDAVPGKEQGSEVNKTQIKVTSDTEEDSDAPV